MPDPDNIKKPRRFRKLLFAGGGLSLLLVCLGIWARPMTEAILTSYLPKLELELTRALGLTVDFGTIEPEFALLRPRFLIQNLKITDPLKDIEVFSAPRAVVEFDLAEMLMTFSPKIRLIEFSGESRLDLTSQTQPEGKPVLDAEEAKPDLSNLPLSGRFKLKFVSGPNPHTAITLFKGERIEARFISLEAKPVLSVARTLDLSMREIVLQSSTWFRSETTLKSILLKLTGSAVTEAHVMITDGSEVFMTDHDSVLTLEVKSVDVAMANLFSIPPFLNPTTRTQVFTVLRKGMIHSARIGVTGGAVSLETELRDAEVLAAPGLPVLTGVTGSVSLLEGKLKFSSQQFEVAGAPGGEIKGSMQLDEGKASGLAFTFTSEVRPAQLTQLTQVEVFKDGLSPIVEKCFPKKAFQVSADYHSSPKRVELAIRNAECEIEEGEHKDLLSIRDASLIYSRDSWSVKGAEGGFSGAKFKLEEVGISPAATQAEPAVETDKPGTGLKTEIVLSQAAVDQLLKRFDVTALTVKVGADLRLEGVTALSFGKGATSGTEWQTDLRAAAGNAEIQFGKDRTAAWASPEELLFTAKSGSAAKKRSLLIEVQSTFAKFRAFGVDAPLLKFKGIFGAESKVILESESLQGELALTKAITPAPAKIKGSFERVYRAETPETEDAATETEDAPASQELTLPSLDIMIKDFKDGKRRYGRVTLKATRELERWSVDESVARGGEIEWDLDRLSTVKSDKGLWTQVKAHFRFRNWVKEFQKSKTLGAIRVDNGIVDLSGEWPGEPQDFTLGRFDGEMKGQFAQGKFEQVRSFGQTLINVLSNSRSDARKEQIQFYLASFRFRILDGFILNDYTQALLGSVLVKITGKSKVKGRTLTMEAAISPGVKDIPVDQEETESHFGTFRYKIGGTWKEPKLGLKLF